MTQQSPEVALTTTTGDGTRQKPSKSSAQQVVQDKNNDFIPHTAREMKKETLPTVWWKRKKVAKEKLE